MTSLKIVVSALFVLPLLACQTVNAKQQNTSPWPEVEPTITSSIFSRTSLTVRSIEESLKLYEGVFGMTPFYDRPNLDDPRLIPFSNLKPGQKMNLTVLRIETDSPFKVNSGYIGLVEVIEADGSLASLPNLSRNAAEYGAATLMFMVPNTIETHEKVKALGYEVISAPTLREDGSRTQLLMRGPDGERIWVGETSNHSVFLDPKP